VGIEGFQKFYEEIYQDRWPVLMKSLSSSEIQMARWNVWAGASEVFEQQKNHHGLGSALWNENLGGFILKSEKVIPQSTSADLLDFYVMDPASVLAAQALEVEDGHRVLDVCAAPGGKSLILIESLCEAGEIFCNDISSDRRERLKKVIQNYVPREVRDRVWVKGQEGAQFGLREPESFDRILVDAPCSGERHLLSDPQALSDWTPRRPEGLAQRQFSLLSGAFLALKPESKMVYSTCSLNPEENDGVVGRLLKRRKDYIEVDEIRCEILPGGEKTEWGWIYLPDRCGFGPLYVSRLFKRNSFKS